MSRRTGLSIASLLVALAITCWACTGLVYGQVEVRLEDNRTKIVLSDPKGVATLLGEFPFFPGLDPANPRVSENLVRFSNGNVVIRVPDVSVTKKVRAWNDLSHVFDVLIVRAKQKSIEVVLKDTGTNLRITRCDEDDTVFVFQIRENDCSLEILSHDGVVTSKAQYRFRAYPSLVSVSKTRDGYLLSHVTLDSEEQFLLTSSNNKIVPVSLKEKGADDERH